MHKLKNYVSRLLRKFGFEIRRLPSVSQSVKEPFYHFRDLIKETQPVIFDVGHSLQRGCSGGSSGSHMEFAEPLLKAALAVGVNGVFMEVHHDPENALSDGTTSVKLSSLKDMLIRCSHLWNY